MKPVPDHIDEYYSNGHCMYLALALNQYYQLSIRVQVETIGGETCIAHAYNVDPASGKEVDILGVQEQVDQFSTTVQCVTADQLLALIGMDGSVESIKTVMRQIDEAYQVVQQYPGIVSGLS